MKKELLKIIIVPAKFIEKADDGKVILRCLLDNEETQDRAFDSFTTEGIENPKYLLIGIMTGVGFIQINVCDGSEFEEYFNTIWKTLTL